MLRALIKIFILVSFILLIQTFTASPGIQQDKPTSFLIRCDDFGMCHAVNMAIKQIIEAQIPISVSVMFTCPWYQEAVEILKQHPEVSVGVHLTLNAEWKNYRWGPVLGPAAVPSLVDSIGYFFPSRSKLFANNPKTSEVEKELRAQLERAKNTGLKLDYIDHHMGAAVQTEELRSLVEKLAAEYELGISQYFGESYSNVTYHASFENKTDSLITKIGKLYPETINLQVFHVGLTNPEMSALRDLNPFGLEEMSRHREGELKALLSPEFKKEVRKHNIRLITYRDVISEMGLKSMKRPTRGR